MNRRLFILMIAVVIFSINTIMNGSIFGSETKTVSFPSYNSEVEEFFDRGWIPENIPKSAKNIELIYDIDTNIVNGSYQMDKNEKMFRELADFKKGSLEDLNKVKGDLTTDYSKIRNEMLNQKNSNDIYFDNKFVYLVNDQIVYFWAK